MRLDVQGSQFLGLSTNDVIALRVSLSYANNQPGDLKTAYGFGVRAGNDKRVFARFDVAFGGGEGTRFFLKFSPSFQSPIPNP